MHQFFSLSVGRADCHVFLLDNGPEARRTCILVDCGWYPPAAPDTLSRFLHELHLDVIDLVIITHLHMDHLAALATLEDSVYIRRIIAPTAARIPVTEAVCRTQPGNKYLLHLMAYDACLQRRIRQGTKVEDVMDYAQGGCVSFGDVTLRCLYPRADTAMPSVTHALRMCDPSLSTTECIACENESRKSANADSSVWLLEAGGVQQLLLMGDAPMRTVSGMLQQGQLHPRLVKLPHHGLDRGYFSQEELHAMAPETLIVCTDGRHVDALASCLAMAAACGAEVHFTCEGTFCRAF